MVILPEGGVEGQSWVESPHPDSGNLIMLDGFGLGVLGELGASRFLGPARVRAKDAKVRKGDY